MAHEAKNRMPNVWLAEDDPGIEQVVTEILVEEGHTVQVSRDANATILGLTQARDGNTSPEIILLDLGLAPDIPEVVKGIYQGHPSRPRIIAFSAQRQELLDQLVKQGRVDEALAKPFDYEDLLNTVKNRIAVVEPTAPDPTFKPVLSFSLS